MFEYAKNKNMKEKEEKGKEEKQKQMAGSVTVIGSSGRVSLFIVWCVCMCAHMCACVCEYVYSGQKSTSSIFLNHLTLCFFVCVCCFVLFCFVLRQDLSHRT